MPRSIEDGFAYVLMCADDPWKQMGAVWDSNNEFVEKGSYPAQAVGLMILRDAAERITVNGGDYLTITNAAGEEMKIYLPALDTTEDVTLYIGKDGATYYDIALSEVACAAPTGVAVRVNFQPAAATSPDGYYRDHGTAPGGHWGSAGAQDYGW
ncbi:MAG: hypothetical protein WCP22_07670 [Chlamydiota bacterium]